MWKVTFLRALKAYNQHIGYIDIVDFGKKNGGGFAVKGNFKKWYKQGFLGTLDFTVVNGKVVWNMSAKHDGILTHKVSNKNWRMLVAKEMLNWIDPLNKDIKSEDVENHNFNLANIN